jgi:predicted ATPase
MRRVWPGLVVEENNFTVQISALRKAIGTTAISTVTGRGYQLTCDPVPAGAPAHRPQGNLPAQATRLLGRDADLQEVIAVLGTTRLLTLTGMGGMGKTHLSLQVAAAVKPRFPDGTWLIELAALADGNALCHAVAGVFGTPQQAGRTIEQSLVDALSARDLLLLLDNCEHIIEAAAALAFALLAGCAQVTVLATSREALMVAGEQVWPVTGLSVKEGDRSPAVELFVDRAHAVAPDFVLGSHADAVIEIRRRLDGIPLAIELAAARVRSMSPAQIRDRLDQRFSLLNGGSRHVRERHQTLHHAVQWSFDLLTQAERQVLTRASVFAGGFELEAAERVCTGAAVQSSDVLDLLDSLARKSLLSIEAAAVARYSLLDTIRHFALEHLMVSGQGSATRTAHARCMADDSDAWFKVWRSPRQREAYDWLDREMGNLRLAFRWAMDQSDVDAAARIASNIGDMARHRLREETSGWAAEIVDAARHTRHRRLCVLLNWAGSTACAMSNFSDARRYGEEAVALADDPDFEPLVLAFVDLAYAAMAEGDVDRALELLRTGAAHPADQQDRYCAACLLAFTSACGRTAEAQRMAHDILAAVDIAGVPCSIVVAHAGQAGVIASIDPEAALEFMDYAIATARASGCRFLETYFTPKLAVMQAFERLTGAWPRRLRDSPSSKVVNTWVIASRSSTTLDGAVIVLMAVS